MANGSSCTVGSQSILRGVASFLLFVGLIFGAGVSAALEAQVVANGFSVSFGPAATNANFTILFTTFDNSTGPPLLDCGPSFCTISNELAPTSPGSRTYRTDYLAEDALGIFEDGTATFTISTTDGDGDGLPDALEIARGGNFSFSGTAVPHFNAFGVFVNSTVSGSVSRSSQNRTGTYQGTFSNATRSAIFAGAFALSGASGTVQYEIGGSTLQWSLSQRGIDGITRTFTGVSQLVRNGIDELQIPSFALLDSGTGLSILTRSALLQRHGNVFRGIISAFDGEPLTSWDDYEDFLVELTDPNDTDSDGLPDIVSVPEPRAIVQALIAVATVGAIRVRRRGLARWRRQR